MAVPAQDRGRCDEQAEASRAWGSADHAGLLMAAKQQVKGLCARLGAPASGDVGIVPMVLDATGTESERRSRHVPVMRETPFPEGGELPRMYFRTLDPFVVLTAAATVTDNLLLGTGVALLVQRDVIHTAKQVASLRPPEVARL